MVLLPERVARRGIGAIEPCLPSPSSYAGQFHRVRNNPTLLGLDAVARSGESMVFGFDLRRQARVCARLAKEYEDQHIAERLWTMAARLAAKADEVKELPSERLRQLKPPLAA